MAYKPKRTNNCPSCGTKLADSEKTCPQCGREFPARGKKPSKSGKKPAEGIKVTCPSCGVSVSQRSKRCPSCRVDLSMVAGEAKIRPIDKKDTRPETKPDFIVQEPTEEAKEYRKVSCPRCGWLLERAVSKCPVCGALPAEARQEAIPTSQVEAEPVEVIRPPGAEEASGTRSCPICATIVSRSFEKCPVCGVTFFETQVQSKVVGTVAESPEAPPPGMPAVPPEKSAAGVEAPKVKRKLRPAKVTTIPVAAPTPTAGVTNGVGAVNGLSRVGGKGLVNGTGVAYGLETAEEARFPKEIETRPSVRAAKRHWMLTRWQLLVVLLAIVVVIPTFVYLSLWTTSDRFSVDGRYSDWKDATTYGIVIPSTASSSNITEWAVGIQSSDLFLYFQTEGNMMSSTDPEGYYLFVDSDGLATTGYIVESIGADYMLQLTGWDSSVESSSLYYYSSTSDRYNWTAWSTIGSLSSSLDGKRLEASARMPEAVGQSAKFVLVSKDLANRGSVSYTAPLEGGLLVVQQAPSAGIATTGVISKSVSVEILTLRFSCQGTGGNVSLVNPVLHGAQLAHKVQAFSLENGEEHELTIAVDTSSAIDCQVISAELFSSSIVSTFASVQIIGSGARAYVVAPPPSVIIDGAFADWAGRLSVDHDRYLVSDPGVDIDEVGNVSTSLSSFFYVSVEGEMCSGTFIPTEVAKPSGGGGGAVIPTRHTAEDILRIYIDSDKSNSSGSIVALDSKQICADQKIEVTGLFGNITSKKQFSYSTSTKTWVEIVAPVAAAKDEKRLEVSISAASIGGSADIDFIVETSSWEGRRDLATFEALSTGALTRTWIVDPTTASATATALSNQRKIFHDGLNYWSFYFDGANTVYKYSSDGGVTWSSPLRAFATPGVNKVSVWYDSAEGVVYAVGDVGFSTRAVAVQRGTVDAAMHTITWRAADATPIVSSLTLGDKNTFISKDASGYLWILTSNNTGIPPTRLDLSTFRSVAVDSIASWTHTGNIIEGGNNAPDCKGSILPAGKGSDMFIIYAYGGNVASRKYTTSWSTENIIYAIGLGNLGNTDNAPPSAVVDSNGVVHVVYGTGRKSGPNSAPTIEYSHNETGQTTFTKGLDLDPLIPGKSGDFYPTITVEVATGSLYVLWLQSDDTLVPRTVMGRSYVAGTWSEMTIEQQTTFAKQYLTAAYSISEEFKLCWGWTQNTTAPMQVLFDSFQIPELFNLPSLALASIIVMCVVYRMRSRSKSG